MYKVNLCLFKKKDATIFDACDEWIRLLNEYETYSDMLQSRFKESVTQVHFLAHRLNPVYMGEGIDEDKQKIIRQWLHNNIDPTFLPLVIAFQRESLTYLIFFFS